LLMIDPSRNTISSRMANSLPVSDTLLPWKVTSREPRLLSSP
jgi:hypothetical protein